MKVLEDKIDVSEALKQPTGDSRTMRLRVKGTNQVLKIDIEKFHEALSFTNTDGTPEPVKKQEGPVMTEEDEKALETLIAGTNL